ncbi:hypothetical protein ACFTTO_30890, partial [Bacillus mobilis]
SVEWLANGCGALREFCVSGIQANEAQLRQMARTSTAQATAFLPVLGYEMTADLARRALDTGRSVSDIAVSDGLLEAGQAESLLQL